MNKVLSRCRAIIAEQSFVYKHQSFVINITVASSTDSVQCYTWQNVLNFSPNALYRSLKTVPGVLSVQVEVVPEP